MFVFVHVCVFVCVCVCACCLPIHYVNRSLDTIIEEESVFM